MNLALLCPEFSALFVLLVLMTGEMFNKDFSHKRAAPTAIAGAGFVLLTLCFRFNAHGESFSGSFRADVFSQSMKIFFAAAVIPVIQMTRVFFKDRLKHPGEFVLVLWSALIGMFFLASANDLLLLFISLEIVTLSFYIMASFMKKELYSIEAGLKYLIFGSLASAFFIYGISLIYAAAGTTLFEGVRQFASANPGNQLVLLGLVLMISGVGFKIALVPFHLWVPDVYEGAPTPGVAFLSVGSKAAGFVIALKLLFVVFVFFESGREALFSVLAALTMLYGSLGALVQKNIKRLFGYSSISHAGYLAIGLATGEITGVTAVLFYLIAYGLSSLAAFLVICIAGRALESDRIESYRGLAVRSPFLGGVLFIALLSLAGMPPLAGFFGKLLILLGAVQGGYLWLALLGAALVAVSLYYYLSIVKIMIAEEPLNTSPIHAELSSKIILAALAGGIIVMGFWQAPFYTFAENAARSFF